MMGHEFATKLRLLPDCLWGVHLDPCSVTRGGRDGMGWRMLTAVSHVIQPGWHGAALMEIPLPSRLGVSAWSHDSACLSPHWKANGGAKQHL